MHLSRLFITGMVTALALLTSLATLPQTAGAQSTGNTFEITPNDQSSAAPTIVPEMPSRPNSFEPDTQAAEAPRGVPAIGVGFGTAGFALSLGLPLGRRFDTRLQSSNLSYSTAVNSSDNQYNGTVSVRSYSLLLDYHLFGNAFILSSGFYFPNFLLNATALPRNGTYTINGVHYALSQVQSLGGTLKWSKPSPYLGIGLNPIQRPHSVGFGGDVGAAFVGAPQVTTYATGAGANNPIVQAGLAAEQKSLQNSANSFTLYPILDFGLRYGL